MSEPSHVNPKFTRLHWNLSPIPVKLAVWYSFPNGPASHGIRERENNIHSYGVARINFDSIHSMWETRIIRIIDWPFGQIVFQFPRLENYVPIYRCIHGIAHRKSAWTSTLIQVIVWFNAFIYNIPYTFRLWKI